MRHRFFRQGFRLLQNQLRAAPRPTSQRFRPLLEGLEHRLLPATFTVTDLGDNQAGSGLQGDLRYCIETADANSDLSNVIVFQPGLTGTIGLQRGRLFVDKNLEIDGPGPNLLTISGNHLSGVFEITTDPRAQDFRLSGVTVADGIGVFTTFGHEGGGLFNWHADVTLTNCVFAGNAVGGPGDRGRGGAIYSDAGNLVLTNCTITDNQANGPDTATGGGIDFERGTLALNHCTISGNSAATEGGGVVNFCGGGVVTATDTIVTGNTARIGGGIEGGIATWIRCTITDNVALSGAGVDAGDITLIDCTIADNVATVGVGGGLYNGGAAHLTLIGCTITGNSAATNGGGLWWPGGLVSITDSTFSGNSAADGGAIYMLGTTNRNSLELTGCTITQNTATAAGGLDITRSDILTIVRDTILAGNQATATAADVRGAVLSLGYNLVGEADDSTGWQATDLTGTSGSPLDPRLGPLQDNGGPTLTHAPFADSPAIGHGDPLFFASFDQRGTFRAFAFRQGPDIGAVDAQNAVAFREAVPDHVTAGQPFALAVVALDQWGNTATTYGGTVHFDSTDLGAALPDDYSFAVGDQGVQTFGITLNTPGTQSLRVNDVHDPRISRTVTIEVDDPSAPGQSPTLRVFVAWELNGTGWHRQPAF
jgi:predicted outer membrane repeat protein